MINENDVVALVANGDRNCRLAPKSPGLTSLFPQALIFVAVGDRNGHLPLKSPGFAASCPRL